MALGAPANIQHVDSTDAGATWNTTYSANGSGRHLIALTCARVNTSQNSQLSSHAYNSAALTKLASKDTAAYIQGGTLEGWARKDPTSGSNTSSRVFLNAPQGGDATSITFEITGGADSIGGASASDELTTANATINLTTTAANSTIIVVLNTNGTFSAWTNSVSNIYSAGVVNRLGGAQVLAGYRSVGAAGTYTVGADMTAAVSINILAFELKEAVAGGETVQGAWAGAASSAFVSARSATFRAGFIGAGASGDQPAKRADMLASMLATSTASQAAVAAMQAIQAVSVGAQAGESWAASMEALSALLAAGEAADSWEAIAAGVDLGALVSQSQASEQFLASAQMLANLQEGADISDAIIAIATLAASMLAAATSAASWVGDKLTENQAALAANAIAADAWAVLVTISEQVVAAGIAGSSFSVIVSQLGAEIIGVAIASAAWSAITSNNATWFSSSVAGSIFSYPGAGYLIASVIISTALAGKISILPAKQGGINLAPE